MILAALGLVILLVRLGINGHGFISKDFFWISICALGVSFASLLSMTVNETSDGAYLSYIVTMWVWVGAAYCVTQMIRAVHGTINAERICFYMISVGVLQCFLAIAIDSIPVIKGFVDSFLAGEGFMGKADGRLYGIGCALDVAGGRFAVLLVMIAFLLPQMYKKQNSNIYIGLLLIAFCIISVIGNMIGRTTSVGMVIGIAYMLSVIFSKQILDKHDRSRYIFGVSSFVCITILVSATLYNVSDYWHDYFRFGFEGFFSLAEKGKWEVQSNNMLMAGLDGIINKINPGDPLDKNLYDLPPEEAADIPEVCGSLSEALEALKADKDFLMQGGVFSDDFINAYCELKQMEINKVNQVPHPCEFELYYAL